MSRARDFADLAGSADAGGLTGRNLIINGAMQVAQRGTSATGLGDGTVGYKTLDRYRLQKAGSPTARYTMTQDSNAPDGFANSLKVEVTTADTSPAATDHQYIDQFIEAQNLQQLAWDTSSNGKKVTLSFYVKCSTAQTFAVDFINEDNSRYFNTTYTVSSADTWERKTITLPADASNGFNDDNGRGLRVRWTLLAGSDYTGGSVSTSWSGTQGRATNHQNTWVGATGRTWQLTGAQFELGETATPFEHRSFGEELARCHRYTYSIQGTGNPLGTSGPTIAGGGRSFFGFGSAHNSANPVTWLNMPTSMRVVPSLTVSDNTHFDYDTGHGSLKTSTSTQLQTLRSSSKAIAIIMNVGSGLTNGDPGSVSANNSAAYMIFDAEL